jgi:hypothetical protein
MDSTNPTYPIYRKLIHEVDRMRQIGTPAQVAAAAAACLDTKDLERLASSLRIFNRKHQDRLWRIRHGEAN